MWHGRNFGVNSLVYLALCLHKSMILLGTILIHNFINGSSGDTIFFSFYWALFGVLNCVYSLGFWLLLDQNVSFDKEKNLREPTKENIDYVPHKDYQPLKGRHIGCGNLKEIFERDEYIEKNNIP